MSSLTSLNLFAKRAAAKPAGRSFEPLAQSAFRTLGLAATASQREVFDASSSVRLALRLGVQKTFEGDLPWLAPVSRTESDVRAALGRLAEPSGRAFERLFWFHTALNPRPASSVAELRAAVDALLSDDSPAARHDAALLMLAGLLRLDPVHEEADAWAWALKLWRETVEREEFWSQFVAADLSGEFEQSVTFGEVRRLRLRTPRLASAPVAEGAKNATLRGDLHSCARAFLLLRGGGLPAALLEEYERDILGPAEDRLEQVCNAAFSSSALAAGFGESAASRYNIVWSNFESAVKPQLRDFVEMGGAESHYVRRALEHASDKLRELADRYRSMGLHQQSAMLLLEARALAPDGCEALESIRAALLIQNPAAEVGERSYEEYAHALARELAESRLPPKLSKAYAAAPVGERDTSDGGCVTTAFFWLFLILCCFGLQRCGLLNTKRSTTLPPANLRMLNMNYDRGIPMPKYTPMPPIVMPPYLMPHDNRNAGRRARRRGAQPSGTTDNTMNLNLSPPVVVKPPLNRNAASPNRNELLRD
ncbi:MAG: hypothetical protein H7Z38_21530 [Rubrivivax sp.]|nr:hypothetical protein [Pyrinomonadaceae bacterium]